LLIRSSLRGDGRLANRTANTRVAVASSTSPSGLGTRGLVVLVVLAHTTQKVTRNTNWWQCTRRILITRRLIHLFGLPERHRTLGQRLDTRQTVHPGRSFLVGLGVRQGNRHGVDTLAQSEHGDGRSVHQNRRDDNEGRDGPNKLDNGVPLGMLEFTYSG